MPTTRYATRGVSHPNPPSCQRRVAVVLVPFPPHGMALELVYWANGGLRALALWPPGPGRVAAVFRGMASVVRMAQTKHACRTIVQSCQN